MKREGVCLTSSSVPSPRFWMVASCPSYGPPTAFKVRVDVHSAAWLVTVATAVVTIQISAFHLNRCFKSCGSSDVSSFAKLGSLTRHMPVLLGQ